MGTCKNGGVRIRIRPVAAAESVDVLVGTVVMVTSVIPAEGDSSYFDPHVEAPAPEHIHEAPTSERTLTPTGTARSHLTASRD